MVSSGMQQMMGSSNVNYSWLSELAASELWNSSSNPCGRYVSEELDKFGFLKKANLICSKGAVGTIPE